MKRFEVCGERRFGPLPQRCSDVIIAKDRAEAWDKAYSKWNKNVESWMHEISVVSVKEIKYER